MLQVDEQKTAITGDGPDTDNTKVAFSAQQQARVQELIDSAYKRAYSKASEQVGGSKEVEMLKDEVESFRQYKKNSMLIGAISKFNVVDAQEIAELISPHLGINERGLLQAQDDISGRNVGVEEFVATWLGERPHHLRGQGGAGAGSQSAKFGGPSAAYDLSDPATWRSIPREDLDRLMKEGINIHGSQGQVFSFKDVKNPFTEARRRKFNSGI